jgi:hypothetical protein
LPGLVQQLHALALTCWAVAQIVQLRDITKSYLVVIARYSVKDNIPRSETVRV